MNMKLMMKNILCLLSLTLAVLLAGAAWGDEVVFDPDPIHYRNYYYHLYSTREDFAYTRNDNDFSLYYQLRDVSGEKRSGYDLAKAQWFATTYENYLWGAANLGKANVNYHPTYRRTMGGETPTVPLTTLADLLDKFDFVYINEPQPYEDWFTRYGNTELGLYYDEYMNPLETVCVVLPEGKGDLTVKFFNHYARHFPYWYTMENDKTMPLEIPSDVGSRDISADVQMAVDGYSIRVTPNTAQTVLSGDFMSANIHIQTQNTGDYGSMVGYLSFRQAATLNTGYSGWREAEHVPVVVANVSDGDASENPLYFDMIIFDSADTTAGDDVVNRVKFRWGAEENLPNQSLGTFFLMQPYNNAEGTPTYGLMTRVTNRTGTRYRLERYSMADGNPLSGDQAPINTGFEWIYPDHWAYDLTPDRYGSLPSRFILDNHSQIAPGLVTVYWKKVGAGYQTINTNVGTSDSFRLYTFDGTTPHNLTLNYTRVAGMVAGEWSSLLDRRVRVRPFTLANSRFVDRRSDEDNTEAELKKLMGMSPVLVDPAALPEISLSAPYINKAALDAFQITAAVPEGLATTVSLAADSDDVTSPDVTPTISKAALLPVVVRFRIPRSEQILSTSDHWTALNNAENGEKLLTEFSKFGTIWVRSENTKMLDANLLKAIGDRQYDASKVVRAFTYNDSRDGEGLYIEFLAFLADAKSPIEGKTAFIDLFKDDDIPYLLIGDGAADGSWDISFFIEATGTNPEGSDQSGNKDSGGGGGGGCDAGALGAITAGLLAGGAFLLRRRMC